MHLTEQTWSLNTVWGFVSLSDPHIQSVARPHHFSFHNIKKNDPPSVHTQLQENLQSSLTLITGTLSSLVLHWCTLILPALCHTTTKNICFSGHWDHMMPLLIFTFKDIYGLAFICLSSPIFKYIHVWDLHSFSSTTFSCLTVSSSPKHLLLPEPGWSHLFYFLQNPLQNLLFPVRLWFNHLSYSN